MSDSEPIVKAIETMATALLDRVNKTETDFVNHLQRVEDRLDQLVELTKNVAVIQANSANQQERMTEFGVQLRTFEQRNEGSTSRIHNRIDDLNHLVGEKLDVNEKKFEAMIAETVIPFSKKQEDLATKHHNLDTEFQKYLNRAVAAVSVIGFVIGTFSWIGKTWVTSLERDRDQIVTTLKETRTDVADLDQRLKVIERKTVRKE